MFSRLTARQSREWFAFREAFGPIGEERMDHRFAKMTSMLVRAFNGQDISPADCMIKFESMSVEDIERRSLAKMKAWQARRSSRKGK